MKDKFLDITRNPPIDDSSASFYIGELLVSPSHNQIEIDNKVIKVQPKAMAVLAYLAQHNDRVISNQELIDTLWTGRIVTLNSVQKSINTLRKTLAKYFPGQTVIENYSKKGYQLKITPVFQAVSQQNSFHLKSSNLAKSAKKQWLVLAILLGLGLVLTYWQLFPTAPLIIKQHKQKFSVINQLVEDKIHASYAVPHPNNQTLVYVQTKRDNAFSTVTQTLLIKQKTKNKSVDWRIASSPSTWLFMAWSPNGKHLVALEQQASDPTMTSGSFYTDKSYFYTFHIFTLDLSQQKLIEKQLLSQWYGKINSLTWVDDNQLEFVASQGNHSLFQRFRYTPANQVLTAIENLPYALSPLSSAILNGKTALLNKVDKTLMVNFIDSKQQLIASWPLTTQQAQISWIPDGSGVLVYSREIRHVELLYLDGQRLKIHLPTEIGQGDLQPSFSQNGQNLYLTQSFKQNNILFNANNHPMTIIGEPNKYYSAASFSPTGSQLAYLSQTGEVAQLWLKSLSNTNNHNNKPKRLDQISSGTIDNLLWLNDTQLLYKSANSLYLYNQQTESKSLILSAAKNLVPINFSINHNILTALITSTGGRNIWRINLSDNSRNQLTFGAIGSAYASKFTPNSKVYFQYIDQPGLWELDEQKGTIKLNNKNLGANSKILFIDQNNIYFISGSRCQESTIFSYHLGSATTSKYGNRNTLNRQTLSFHPDKGDLTVSCIAAHSTIISYQ